MSRPIGSSGELELGRHTVGRTLTVMYMLDPLMGEIIMSVTANCRKN